MGSLFVPRRELRKADRSPVCSPTSICTTPWTCGSRRSSNHSARARRTWCASSMTSCSVSNIWRTQNIFRDSCGRGSQDLTWNSPRRKLGCCSLADSPPSDVHASTGGRKLSSFSASNDRDGMVTALAWDQLEDCGAYLRAPEPATLYRMHGNMTGAYRMRNLRIRNRVALTNKTPSGLVRGFGGPQVYFALERLMQRIAVILGLDPLAVIRRNP